MLIKNTSKIALLGSLILCAGLYHYGSTAALLLQEKAIAQEDQLTEFAKWKAKYSKLVHIEQAWTDQIFPLEHAKDLYSLYKMVDAGQAINPDTLVVDTVLPLKVKDTAVKGQRVCLSSLGGKGMTFTGDSVPQLYDQYMALVGKPGITFDAITVSFDQATSSNKPSKAILEATGFCITLRA